MQTTRAPLKRCYACTFWAGSRSLNMARSAITFETNDKAICSFTRFDNRKGDYSCSHYEKWNAVK